MQSKQNTAFRYLLAINLLIILIYLLLNNAFAKTCAHSVNSLYRTLELNSAKRNEIKESFQSDMRYGFLEVSQFSVEAEKIDTMFSVPAQQLLFHSKGYEKFNTDIYFANQKAKKDKLKKLTLPNFIAWTKVAASLENAPSKTHDLTDPLANEFRRLMNIEVPIEKDSTLRSYIQVETEKRLRLMFSLFRHIREKAKLPVSENYLTLLIRTFENIEGDSGLSLRLFEKEKEKLSQFIKNEEHKILWHGPLNQVSEQLKFLAKKYDDFSEFLNHLNIYLNKKIEHMPVGITYRVKDLTAGFRFGEKSFLGGYMNYRNFTRSDWLERIKKRHGLMEAHFRFTNQQKKRVGISLDRAHRSEDYLFGNKEVCDRHFHVCGTYANYMVMKHGIPIYSYGYLTPGHALMSLALQRLAGSRQLKHLSFKHRRPDSLWNTAKIFSWHEFGAYAVLEFQIYALIWTAGHFAYHELADLFLEDSSNGESIAISSLISEEEFDRLSEQITGEFND